MRGSDSAAQGLTQVLRVHPAQAAAAAGCAAPAVSLLLHPARGGPAGSPAGSPGSAPTLELEYRLPRAGLRLPAAAAPGRRDDLWQHTCAELFIADGLGSAYREFNFSPNGQWAIYDFSACRQRAPAAPDSPTAPDSAAPRIRSTTSAAWLHVQVHLPAAALPVFAHWRVGLACVLESSAGEITHWALHHPAAQADFHHRDSFVLPLDPHRADALPRHPSHAH